MENSGKKLFIITQSDLVGGVGGAITVFKNFCNMLTQNGYEVFAICSNKTNKIPEGINKEVKFINLYHYYKKKSFSEAVNKLIAEEKPDLLIFFFHYLYNSANLSEEFDNIPRILMFHSRPDFYFAYQKESEENLKKLYKNTVSQVLFESYIKLLPDFIKNNSVVVIPNSVRIQPKTIDVETEKKKIIYLSRIDCWKGVEFLINSFKCIAKKYPDWSIDIYGQVQPKDYINVLNQLVKKLGLEKQICFKGVTNNPVETLLQYDICAFPSYFEGFPMGVVEAMSVGLPIVGLKECSGVNELILDNENGFLAEENYEDYAKKLEALMTDKALRKRFSDKTTEIVKSYNKASVDKMWLETIEKVLSKEIITSAQNVSSKPIFPIKKIMEMLDKFENNITFKQKLFSVKNKYIDGKKKKTIYILGIKIVLTFSRGGVKTKCANDFR